MLLTHDQIHRLFLEYGYWAVAIVVGLESIGLPFPGEATLIAASAYAATHDGSVAAVIAAAAIGAVVGDNIGYLIGYYLGYPFLRRFGRYVGLTDGRFRLGQYLFLRHGGAIVFFGRFVSFLRILAALLAGANRMAWPRFLVANAAGAIVWSTAVGLAGSTFGRQLHAMHGPIAIVGMLLTVAAVVACMLYLRRHEAALQVEADKALGGR